MHIWVVLLCASMLVNIELAVIIADRVAAMGTCDTWADGDDEDLC